MTITYLTYADLSRDVADLASKLPRKLRLDLAGVLGVPRSGMLPATILANNLHLPVTDCFSFARLGYRFSTPGKRLLSTQASQGRYILVVDDSAYAGTAMTQALSVLQEGDSNYRYVSAVCYRCPDKAPSIDYYSRDIPKPRYFEWNLIQHPDMASFMLDFDGVLCYDPPHSPTEDLRYALSIKSAVPLYLPKYPVHSICTMRLERYRGISEKWLSRYGVKYNALLMAKFGTATARRKHGNYGAYKGDIYKNSDATLFIESNTSQAIAIAYTSKKPVISLEHHTVYQM